MHGKTEQRVPVVGSPVQVLIEGCVDSVAAAIAAVAAGAGRIELCGPGNGGTTPSADVIVACRAAVSVPLHVMIRPHDGGFTYDDDELAVMTASIATARRSGADGVVFGALLRSGRLAEPELALLAGHARGLHTVVHRAFDRVPDPQSAFETLCELGIDTVLTSGLAPTALEGAATLRRLHAQSAGRTTILAGGGIRPDNVLAVLEQTGVTQVHARATDPRVISGIFAVITSASAATSVL